MPGLTFSNELISRDEGLHCDFACLLYSYDPQLRLAGLYLIVCQSHGTQFGPHAQCEVNDLSKLASFVQIAFPKIALLHACR